MTAVLPSVTGTTPGMSDSVADDADVVATMLVGRLALTMIVASYS